MTTLDLLLAAVVLAFALRGWWAGLARQAFSVGFFLGGLVLGALLAPWVASQVDGERGKAFATLATVVVTAAVVGMVGEALGARLGAGLRRARLGWLDSALGAVFGFAGTLLLVWVAAAMLASTSLGGFGAQLQQSRIVQELNDRLPPSPPLLARIERFLDPLGFPRVFDGFEPEAGPPVALPGLPELQGAVDAGTRATVRVQGTGCGGILTGSGFVAAPGLVVTNAHVVAGAGRLVVRAGGRDHAAVAASFDPRTDVAVLRVEGLEQAPLALATERVDRGAPGVILGYPGGGGLTVGAGGVLRATDAVGRDIYSRDRVERQVYVLQGRVRPGSSGGPFVLADGRVAGVVFARSISDESVAYALQAAEVVDDLAAAAVGAEVSTGSCAAD